MNCKIYDQYYTKPEIAKECIYSVEHVIPDFHDYDIILEPSAGTGAFYQFLPPKKRLGLDIEPKYLEIDTTLF